jgi:hypothetical protein
MRLVVIGGSDAGISAGLRAREMDPSVEVSLLVADAYPNFSICGLPYYRSVTCPSGGIWPTAPAPTWRRPGWGGAGLGDRQAPPRQPPALAVVRY